MGPSSAPSTPAAARADGPAPVLVGGVGELWLGDLDLGRRAAERLAQEDLGPGVLVEDLSYGPVQASWRLDDLRPAALILVGAAPRGRPPGTLERRTVAPFAVPQADAVHAVREAITGYVRIDLLLEVLAAFEVLPARTIVVEVEPATRATSLELSAPCAAALDRALDVVRAEVRAACASRPS